MNQSRFARLGVVGGVVLASLLVGAGATPPDSTAVEALEAAAPDLVESAAAAPSTTDGSELGSTDAMGSVLIPEDISDGIEVVPLEGRDFTITPLFADGASSDPVELDGVRTWDVDSSVSAYAALNDEGAVSTGSVLLDSSAPRQYEWQIALSAGDDVVLEADEHGGVVISDADGEFVGAIAPAWALDAREQPVETWYSIDGSLLTQHVAPVASHVYPIVADPTPVLRWITGIRLDTSDSRGVIVRVSHRSDYPPPHLFNWEIVWTEFRSITPQRYHTQTIKNQLFCHIGNARYKHPWNLETWRPNVGLPATVIALCNP